MVICLQRGANDLYGPADATATYIPAARLSMSHDMNSVIKQKSYSSLRSVIWLQCFDAVGWAAGRASGL